MIEDLARKAADDLRASTTSDVEAGLLDVYAAHRRYRRTNAWAAVAAVALALGIGWWGGHMLTGSSPATPQPLGGPTPPVIQPRPCSGPVACLGSSTYRFALTRAVRWHIPKGYGVNSGGGVGDWLVESYAQRRSSGGGPYSYDTIAGVTVLEGVRVASADGRSARPGVARTPHAFVSWLAARPYLAASAVVPTQVDGRPAWRVRVTLRAGSGEGPASCNGRFACYATTYTPDGNVTGIWGDMVADYTALRVPGAGTTVVWSWAFSRDEAALTRNLAAVHGLSWPGA
jgi:hypothetical protein